MQRLYIPNFTFEDELSSASPARSSTARRRLWSLSPVMPLLSRADGDGLRVDPKECLAVCDVRPEGVPSCLARVTYLREAELPGIGQDSVIPVPWGASERVRRVLRRAGLPNPSFPELAAVRLVNSRAFQAEFDRDAESGSRFSALCASLAGVREAIRGFGGSCGTRWVIKAELSHAGRGRVTGAGAELTSATRGWLERRFRANEIVLVEPWHECIAQIGQQYEVIRSADNAAIEWDVKLVGLTRLLTDARGQYLGSLCGPADALSAGWQPAIVAGHEVVREAGRRGFFGPVGIDSMAIRRPGGGTRIRAVQDINGRLTMGRLALAAHALVRPARWSLWFSLSSLKFEPLRESLHAGTAPDVDFVRTSPGHVEGQPVDVITGVLASENPAELARLWAQISGDPVEFPMSD